MAKAPSTGELRFVATEKAGEVSALLLSRQRPASSCCDSQILDSDDGRDVHQRCCHVCRHQLAWSALFACPVNCCGRGFDVELHCKPSVGVCRLKTGFKTFESRAAAVVTDTPKESLVS